MKDRSTILAADDSQASAFRAVLVPLGSMIQFITVTPDTVVWHDQRVSQSLSPETAWIITGYGYWGLSTADAVIPCPRINLVPAVSVPKGAASGKDDQNYGFPEDSRVFGDESGNTTYIVTGDFRDIQVKILQPPPSNIASTTDFELAALLRLSARQKRGSVTLGAVRLVPGPNDLIVVQHFQSIHPGSISGGRYIDGEESYAATRLVGDLNSRIFPQRFCLSVVQNGLDFPLSEPCATEQRAAALAAAYPPQRGKFVLYPFQRGKAPEQHL